MLEIALLQMRCLQRLMKHLKFFQIKKKEQNMIISFPLTNRKALTLIQSIEMMLLYSHMVETRNLRKRGKKREVVFVDVLSEQSENLYQV